MTEKNKKYPRISVIIPRPQLDRVDGLVRRLNDRLPPFASRITRHGLFRQFIDEGIEKLDDYITAEDEFGPKRPSIENMIRDKLADDSLLEGLIPHDDHFERLMDLIGQTIDEWTGEERQ